jgi:acyl-CoA reductase-like NAD-dependent aldehyde dehydrogenase
VLQTEVPLVRDKAFINGAWVIAASGKMFDVIDPASGNVVGSVPDMDAHDTAKAIEAAADSFQTWKNTTAKVVIEFYIKNLWLQGILKRRGTFVQIGWDCVIS